MPVVRPGVLVALVVVMVLSGAALAMRDRGHDPFWSRDEGRAVARLALAPDAAFSAALLGAEAPQELVVRSGATGALRFRAPVPVRAEIAAGADFVAVAHDVPDPRLRILDARTGLERANLTLDGPPRALAASGPRVAVALADANRTLLFVENGTVVARFSTSGSPQTIDAAGPVAVVGTREGGLRVYDARGPVMQTSLQYVVRDVALDREGRTLAVAASGSTASPAAGAVFLFDLSDPAPHVPQWSHEADAAVSAVAVSAGGAVVLAFVDRASEDAAFVFDRDESTPRATLSLGGAVQPSSIALSSDGGLAAAAPLDADLEGFRGGSSEWSYRSSGTSALAAADAAPRFSAAFRLAPKQDFTVHALFGFDEEPSDRALGRNVALVLGAELAVGLVLWGAFVARRR
ncbi:MAG: YncE family protein [Methanobacteriota archaeon]